MPSGSTRDDSYKNTILLAKITLKIKKLETLNFFSCRLSIFYPNHQPIRLHSLFAGGYIPQNFGFLEYHHRQLMLRLF